MSRYIDADKLKSEFPIRRNNYDEEHGDVHFINGIESVFEYIDYMPTADVEEMRHGEWIASPVRQCSRRNTNHKKYHCSECGKDVGNRPNYKRCPECGAKMDGGKI